MLAPQFVLQFLSEMLTKSILTLWLFFEATLAGSIIEELNDEGLTAIADLIEKAGLSDAVAPG